MSSIYEYGFIRIGCVSPDLMVANTTYNSTVIIKISKELSEKDVQFILFPELSVTGYSCGDLFYQDSLIKSSTESIIHITKETKNLNSTLIVGFPFKIDDELYNCAAVIK